MCNVRPLGNAASEWASLCMEAVGGSGFPR